MSLDLPLVAFITGANGLTGEYIVRQLSTEPRWTRIIATSKRPIASRIKDDRIVYAQADLNVEATDIENLLYEIEATEITHFFHLAYMHSSSLEKQYEYNVKFFKNILIAVDRVNKKTLRRLVLQTGAKYYGFAHKPPPREPITEALGRCGDGGPPIFYYEQEDALLEVQEGRSWTWTTTRPFLISGFTLGKLDTKTLQSPDQTTKGSGQSFMPTAAIYFTMQKYLGEPAYFAPKDTGDNCYDKRQDISSAKHIASFTSRLATAIGTENQHYNIVDNPVTPITFRDIWEHIGAYFNVPVEVRPGFDIEADIAEKLQCGVWKELAAKHGEDPEAPEKYATWFFFGWVMQHAYWGAHVSVEKAEKEVGWTEQCDSLAEMREVFDEMRQVGAIPSI